ncbi:hypothetical protein M405DRAFT_854334 [Rhizopogon salebrosus TDB-379]|nr:hypothetical protein M405DRAFT_854334 [Rhizopogon salebrosus TDB-379]
MSDCRSVRQSLLSITLVVANVLLLPVLPFILCLAPNAIANPTRTFHEKRPHTPGWTRVEPHHVKLSPTRGWLEVISTVEEAENILNAEHHVYDYETGTKHVAYSGYHLPEHVDFVAPTIHFDAKLRQSTRAPIGQPGRIGPETTGEIQNIFNQLEDCDDTLYGLWYEPATEKNSFGIVEYTPQADVWSDLDMFAKKIQQDLKVFPLRIIQTVNRGFDYNGESALDLEYGMTLVGDVIKTDWADSQVVLSKTSALDGAYCTYDGSDNTSQDPVFPDHANCEYNGKEVCGTAQPTNVISMLYGYNEASLSAAHAIRQCNEYAKVAYYRDPRLISSQAMTPNGTIFNPNFSATRQSAIAVGATQVSHSQNYFSMPAYQRAAVEECLATQSISYPEDMYNSTGGSDIYLLSRAYPDLFANKTSYIIAVDGKPLIGFINLTIYLASFAGEFHDITNGTNSGCGTLGFNATVGWDPVTGLGMPNFLSGLGEWLTL